MSWTGRTVRNAAGWLPASLLRPFGGPVAMFFHGVEREILDPDLQDNHHALEDFRIIAAALNANFEVLPLGELSDALARPKRHRRTVFLMADDGYANNLHTASQVLQDLRLPWTLFVSTDHIDSGEPNPMFVANMFSRRAPDGAYDLPHVPEPVRLNGSRASAAVQMREWLRFLPAQRAKDAVRAMRGILEDGEELRFPNSERFLNWDEVRALAGRGVTIGAHAHWHWALHENEEGNFLRIQAELPKRRIETELAVACRYFAYPFGNVRDISRAAWQAVRDAGYEYGFTTLSGTLGGSTNSWLLPRYGLRRNDRNLPAVLPLLRVANARLAQWQKSLA